MTPFGDIDLGQHSCGWWFAAFRNRASTGTNVSWSAVLLHGNEENFTENAHDTYP